MNMIEKQIEFGRTLMEINQNTLQELFKVGQENMQKYMAMNTEFGQRLPEVRDVTTFVELQREYGETLWSSMREAGQGQADIVKSAVEETNEAVKKAFAA